MISPRHYGSRLVGIAVGLSALTVLILAGCSSGQHTRRTRVSTIALSELTTFQIAYDGKTVETTGVVREYVVPRHAPEYWIEDAASNRVGLRPARLAAPLTNQTADVVGHFSYSDRSGRLLTIDRIRPRAPSAAPNT